jgi:ABC-type antimicrobial peptide transport system permease subunit
MLEAFYLSVFGSLAGAVLGSGILKTLEITGIDIAAMTGDSLEVGISGMIYPQLTFSVVLVAVSLGVLVTTFFSYFPTKRAAKLDPVEALRKV